MRKLTYLAAFALAATAAFTACNKDDDDNNSDVAGSNRKSTMVANEWLVTKLIQNGADSTSTLEACEKDNVWKFAADNKFVQMEGATKCDAADPDTADNGTYVFTSDYDSVTVTSPSFTFGLPFKAAVTEFKSTTFTIQLVLGPVTEKVTWNKK